MYYTSNDDFVDLTEDFRSVFVRSDSCARFHGLERTDVCPEKMEEGREK